ncbi:hypothetical protein [Bradyrhizobium sp.]
MQRAEFAIDIPDGSGSTRLKLARNRGFFDGRARGVLKQSLFRRPRVAEAICIGKR